LSKQFNFYINPKRGQVSEQKLSMGQIQLQGKKVNDVYSTKDYNKFKFRGDNRIVKDNHVKGLIQNMKERGWEPGSYVVINEKGEIIDGQHRVKAAIQVGIPVHYTIEKKAGFETIRNLNRNQKNWAITDHIHGFVQENNPHYIKLNNFIKEFPELKVTECMMLCKNSFSSVSREEFESGNFKTKDMSKAREWGNNIMSLKPYFKGYSRSIFVRALVKLLSNKQEFKFDRFLHKVQLRPNLVFMCGTVEQYVTMIEDVYNYSSRKKINLRF
jgi:hypothetical protein